MIIEKEISNLQFDRVFEQYVLTIEDVYDINQITDNTIFFKRPHDVRYCIVSDLVFKGFRPGFSTDFIMDINKLHVLNKHELRDIKLKLIGL